MNFKQKHFKLRGFFCNDVMFNDHHRYADDLIGKIFTEKLRDLDF